MTCVVGETENNGHNKKTLEPVKYRFDYPLPINIRGTRLRVRGHLLEYVRDYPTFGYKTENE